MIVLLRLRSVTPRQETNEATYHMIASSASATMIVLLMWTLPVGDAFNPLLASVITMPSQELSSDRTRALVLTSFVARAFQSLMDANAYCDPNS